MAAGYTTSAARGGLFTQTGGQVALSDVGYLQDAYAAAAALIATAEALGVGSAADVAQTNQDAINTAADALAAAASAAAAAISETNASVSETNAAASEVQAANDAIIYAIALG